MTAPRQLATVRLARRADAEGTQVIHWWVPIGKVYVVDLASITEKRSTATGRLEEVVQCANGMWLPFGVLAGGNA